MTIELRITKPEEEWKLRFAYANAGKSMSSGITWLNSNERADLGLLRTCNNEGVLPDGRKITDLEYVDIRGSERFFSWTEYESLGRPNIIKQKIIFYPADDKGES